MVRFTTLRLGQSPKETLRYLGLYYNDTFSHVAKINSIRILLSMDAIRPLPLCQPGIKMSFYMVISKRKCIWRNHLGLLLKGSPLRWYVSFMGLFVVLNSLHELGLIDSSLQCNNLARFVAKPTTQYFNDIQPKDALI